MRIRRLNGELAAIRHRIAGIDRYGLLVLEPVDCCGEAEHAHEG
jgi:hypothetical protein